MKSENSSLLAATASVRPATETDAVIVGAGPVGLFQVFELGLLEIKAHVIDSLPKSVGNAPSYIRTNRFMTFRQFQCAPARNSPTALLKQIEPFGATIHLGQEVTTVEKRDDGRFYVETSKGQVSSPRW